MEYLVYLQKLKERAVKEGFKYDDLFEGVLESDIRSFKYVSRDDSIFREKVLNPISNLLMQDRIPRTIP